MIVYIASKVIFPLYNTQYKLSNIYILYNISNITDVSLVSRGRKQYIFK